MKKHRGSRAYRLKAELTYPDERFPFMITECDRWFAVTQKEARRQFIEWATAYNNEENIKVKCAVIARK